MPRAHPYLRWCALLLVVLANSTLLWLEGYRQPPPQVVRTRIARQLFGQNFFRRRSNEPRDLPFSQWPEATVVPDSEIKQYVDLVLSNPNSQVNDPAVPDFIEREVYFVVVRLVLQMVHDAIGVLDQKVLFGRTLRMMLTLHKDQDGHGLQRADVELTQEMVDFAMREVVSPFQGGKAIISVEADKIMYRNAVKFAWRLIIDMLSSLQLSASGVKVRLEVSSDVKSASKSLKLSQLDLKPYEKSCQPLIREWIDQRKLPLPRSLQESLYTNLLRLLAYCAAAAVESSQLDVFGVTVDPRM